MSSVLAQRTPGAHSQHRPMFAQELMQLVEHICTPCGHPSHRRCIAGLTVSPVSPSAGAAAPTYPPPPPLVRATVGVVSVKFLGLSVAPILRDAIAPYLWFPFTGASIERSFSVVGDMHTKKRQAMKPTLREAAVVLPCNGDIELH